jgi:hypothetical protein
VFSDTKPCNPLGVDRYFGGDITPQSSTLKIEVICFPKRHFTFSGLHGIISQKIHSSKQYGIYVYVYIQ